MSRDDWLKAKPKISRIDMYDQTGNAAAVEAAGTATYTITEHGSSYIARSVHCKTFLDDQASGSGKCVGLRC